MATITRMRPTAFVPLILKRLAPTSRTEISSITREVIHSAFQPWAGPLVGPALAPLVLERVPLGRVLLSDGLVSSSGIVLEFDLYCIANIIRVPDSSQDDSGINLRESMKDSSHWAEYSPGFHSQGVRRFP